MQNTIEKENYLKVVYKMEEKHKKISVTSLSKYFNVSKSTVSNMIKKLVIMNMIDSKP
ncbi:MAG: metal-dependent transcriptional regulator, partial [Flavobacteriales bacterium]